MKKKLTAFMLAVLMAFSVVPMSAFTAFAADATLAAPIEIEADYSWYDAEATELTISDTGDLAGFAKLTQGAIEGVTEAADSFAGKTVTLANGIEFADGEYWYYNNGTTVYDYRINNFAGTFDGNKNTITNLSFLQTTDTNEYIGLFQTVAFGGTLKNLNLKTVNGTFGDAVRYGTIAGYLYGNMNDCTITDVTIELPGDSGSFRGAGAAYNVGGKGELTVSDCKVNGFDVNSNLVTCTYVAGLLGTVQSDVTVTGCSVENFTVDTKADIKNSGGLTGKASGTKVENCTVTNATFNAGGQLSRLGGLTGYVTNTSYFNSCSATNVTFAGEGTNPESAVYIVGGLFGQVDENSNFSTIEDCSVDGVSITNNNGGFQFVGGVIGETYGDVPAQFRNVDGKNITITGLGDVKKFGTIGGLIGYIYMADFTDCDIDNVTITARRVTSISGGDEGGAGGAVGCAAYANMNKCTVGNVTIKTDESANKTGGFVGVAMYSDFTDCTAETVTMNLGDSTDSVIAASGGFIGQIYSGNDNKVTNCSITGLNAKLTGSYETTFGGFVGTSNATTEIADCSVAGTIDATGVPAVTDGKGNETGGFIGDLGYGGGSSTTISGSSAAVDIEANGDVGGFIASSTGYNGGVGGEIEITGSTATGNVTSIEGAAGGFIGTGDRGTFENCEATGSVTGAVAGGFAGEIKPNTTANVDNKEIVISGSSATGTVSGTDVASGFIGTLTTSEANNTNATNVQISNSTATPDVSSESGEVVDFAKEEVAEGSTSTVTVERGFSVLTDKKEVAVGETVTVKVMLNGIELVGAEWTFVYDSNAYELVSSTLGENVMGNADGWAIPAKNATFAASELLATYTLKAKVQTPIVASAFRVTGTNAWNLGEANASDDTPIPGEVKDAPVEVVDPEYLVEVGENDYVAGKKLVLVYTNSEAISFAYAGATMYDVSEKYTKDGYARSYAIVVDAIDGDYAENVTIVYGTVAADYVIAYDAENIDYDLNDSGEFNLRDVTAAFGVYNGAAETFAGYMNIVLNADVDADGFVGAYDLDAFVQAYQAN